MLCVGDSMMRAFDDKSNVVSARSWMDLVTTALGAGSAQGPGDGFRGLWLDEWTRRGDWKEPAWRDRFDVAPFGWGAYNSAGECDELTWTKRKDSIVAAFDVYCFDVPGLGNWQFRVDEGPWRNAGPFEPIHETRLRRLAIREPVQSRVQVRGFDGTAPCIAAVAGICVYADRSASSGDLVHDLGLGMQFLSHFCRWSAGDPLALLDELRPDLVIAAFSNDVLFDDVATFERGLRRLAARVAPFADLFLISPYEQRPPRRVRDATTRVGSRVVESDAARFVPSDVSCVAAGTNIPNDPSTSITSVQSSRAITISAPATASCAGGELVIGRGREVEIQAKFRLLTRRVAESVGCAHLDLYDAWSDLGAHGWEAATAMGLMVDQYHASPRGHRDIAARVLDVLGAS